MYEQDYDEQYVMFQSWGIGGQVCWGGCSPSSEMTQWTWEIAPYLKNVQVFSDPLYGQINLPAWEQPLYPDYGYNYTTLSPSFGSTSPWKFDGQSEAAITAPAATVMFTGRFDSAEGTGTYWYGPGTMLNIANSEAPDCSDIPSYCWTDWCPNGNDSGGQGIKTLVDGGFTGGDSVRKNGNMNFSFVDGHAKFVQPGQGAAGTTWHQGSLAGTIHITNPSIYLWQVIPSGV
jgi:prepilin-type processing-associated H-X9-DG protein